MTIEIPLSKTGKKNAGKYVAIIDECDVDLAELSWKVSLDTQTNYAERSTRGKVKTAYCRMHRVIMERILGRPLANNELVDHINRNGLDNRRHNLRIANHGQNAANRVSPSYKTEGLKGAYKSKKRWRSRIKVDGKSISLGSFATEQEAHAAYCKAAEKYHGEFANFG